MKRVLVLDGGGVRGLIQTEVLKQLEEKTGKRCFELFDLIVGTSVGAIQGALLASGKLSANEISDVMAHTIPLMFKRRILRWPRYSRKELEKVFSEKLGVNFLMSNCQTKYICTSVNMVDGRTHFFKSWEDKDGQELLLDVVNRSYAAPLYFGAIVDDKHKSVWLDGGTGNANCPLFEAVVETVRQEWLGEEELHILSLGTGWSNYAMPFKRAKRVKTISQLLFFMDPFAGGLARNQSIQSRVYKTETLAKVIPDFSFQRLDRELGKKLDILDGVKYMPEYEDIGKNLAKDLNLLPFKSRSK